MPRYKTPDYPQTNVDIEYKAMTNGSWPRPESPKTSSEPHYERIPAHLGDNLAVQETTLTSGSYNHLLDKPTAQKSGKYDSLLNRERTPENPYEMEPSAYEMGTEAKARRDMYTLLPSPEELEKMRNDA